MRFFASVVSSLVLTAVVATSCGKGDKSGGDNAPPPNPPGENPPAPSANTGVGFMLIQNTLPKPTVCRNVLAAPTLTNLSTSFALDGAHSEWQGASVFLSDPGTDVRAGFDIKQIFTGQVADGFALFVPEASSAALQGAPLHFEWGGAVLRNGQLIQTIAREYRIDHEKIYTRRDGAWHAVNDQDGRLAFGANGLEVWFGLRELESAMFYPSWYLRAYTQSLAGVIGDMTTSVYAESLLSPDQPMLRAQGCAGNRNGNETFSYSEVRQTRSVRSSVDATALNAQIDTAFSAARLAFDHWVVSSNRRIFPASGIAVVLTDTPSAMGLYQDRLDSVDQMMRGIFLGVDDLRTDSPHTFVTEQLYDQSIQQIIDMYLAMTNPAAPAYLRVVVRQALRTHMLQSRVSLSYWFDNNPESSAAFLGQIDSDAPISLVRRFAAIDADSKAVALAKARSLGDLLANTVPMESLIKAWEQLAQESLTGMTEEQHGLRYFGLTKADSLVPGWITSAPYNPEYAPQQLADSDYDGVPNYFEAARGLNMGAQDTDQDGWSDLSEIITGKDPLRPQLNPGAIVADGYFGDWEELLPGRIQVDEGALAGGCPQNADITHYSALVANNALVIGAYGADFWQKEPRVRWETSIDFPEQKRSLVLRVIRGDYAYEILDGKTLQVLKRYKKSFPQGLSSVEWSINEADLGFAVDLNKAGAVKLRLMTVFEGEQRMFCDDTPWFDPLLGENKR